jgi:hypothetical protein
MKKLSIFAVLFVLGTVFAHGGGHEDFSDAEQLVNSGIDCSDLTDDQLEEVGDYIMEQMHPGDMHKRMDQMMGWGDSDRLRQLHINMAQNHYCNEHETSSTNHMSYNLLSNMQFINWWNIIGGFFVNIF